MSLTSTTIKTITAALAVTAIAAPAAGAQAPVPPPPSLPPSFADTTSTAPAGDTTPVPAADTPAAPAQSESPAPTSSPAPAAAQQSATAPPVVKVSKAPPVVKRKAVKRRRKVVKCRRTKHHRTRCAVKRHTVRHRKHAVKGRAAAVTPWYQDAEPMCSYNTARQDIIGTIAPAMSVPTGASAGYLAYQPLYYYYNFATGQWTYAASGEWMWSYRDAAFGTRRWQFFNTALQADLLGEQDMTVSRGYYWKVAVRHYWYPTSTTAGISAPLVWAPGMETNFVPSDIFSASLYTPTHGDYCYSV
jgi:hypothetical protein